MIIYLDVSCLNRPFDDQTQTRIRLESVAISIIFARIDAGRWEQISSRMAEIEISAISNEIRRRRVLRLLPDHIMELTDTVFDRARGLVKNGVHAADAVHVAAAEVGRANAFLTCDERLLRKCRRIARELKRRVANPTVWLKEQNNENS